MYCSHCGSQLAPDLNTCASCGYSTHDQNQPYPAIKYFVVSPKRFVILAFITINLYQLYWFIKNWYIVEKAEGISMWPFWRGVFSEFFCYSFFRRAFESAGDYGYRKKYSTGLLAAAYIVVIFIMYFGLNYGFVPIIFLYIFILILQLPLLPVLQAMKFNNEHVDPEHPSAEGFSSDEIMVIIAGVVLSFIVLTTFILALIS